MEQNPFLTYLLFYKMLKSKEAKENQEPSTGQLPSAKKYSDLMESMDASIQNDAAVTMFGTKLVTRLGFGNIIRMIYSRCAGSYLDKQITYNGETGTARELSQKYAENKYRYAFSCHIFDVPAGTKNGTYDVEFEWINAKLGQTPMANITSPSIGIDPVEFSIFANKVNQAMLDVREYAEELYDLGGGDTDYVDPIQFVSYRFVVCDGKAMAYSGNFNKPD